MEKRGLAPLIATILIIGFVVVLATMILFWGSSFLTNLKESSEKMALESISCSTDVAIHVKSACSMGNEAVFFVENVGSRDFKGFLIIFYGSEGGDSISIEENLLPYEIKKLNPSFDADKIGEINKLRIYPLILLGGKTVLCSNKYDETESFEDCNLACKNAHPDLCDGLDLLFGEGYREMCCEEFELCC